MIHKIAIFISSAILSWLIAAVFVQRGVTVTFSADGTERTRFQIFYTTPHDSKFDERKSGAITVDLSGSQKILMLIPARRITKIRLDPGDDPRSIPKSVSDFAVNGTKLDLNDTSEFHLKTRYDNGRLLLLSAEKDPQVVLNQPVDAIGMIVIKRRAEFVWQFALIFILVLSIMIPAFRLCGRAVTLLRRRLDLPVGDFAVFIVLCAMTGPPFLGMLHRTKKLESENRMAATFPTLRGQPGGGPLNDKFGREFDGWFSDQFINRNGLVIAKRKIDMALSGDYSNDDVAHGKNGWFYIKWNNGLNQCSGRGKMPEQALTAQVEYIQKIGDFCKNNDKKCYLLISVSKCRVYPEYLPKSVTYDGDPNKQNAESLDAAIPKDSGVTVIYPLANLIKNKVYGEWLYWKNDVHWTPLGAYYAWQVLESAIQRDVPQIKLVVPNDHTADNLHPTGDLNRYNPAMPHDRETRYKYPKMTLVPSSETDNPNVKGHKIQHYSNPHGFGRAIVIGTSMIPSMEPYMSNTFKELTVIRQTTQIVPDYIRMLKHADIIILNIHERGLQYPIQLKADLK